MASEKQSRSFKILTVFPKPIEDPPSNSPEAIAEVKEHGLISIEDDMLEENEMNIAQTIQQVDGFHDWSVIGDVIPLHELHKMRAYLVEIQRVQKA